MKLWPFRKNKTESAHQIKDGKIISKLPDPPQSSELPTFTNPEKPDNEPIDEPEIRLAKITNPEEHAVIPDISEVGKNYQPDQSNFVSPQQIVEVNKSISEVGKNYQPLNSPLTKPTYNPSFLIDDPDGGDLGLYLHYLEINGKKKRTRSEYMIDLRIWKRELAGEFPTAEKVKEITRSLKPHRGHRLITALKSYAKYRNLYNDSRLVVMFSTAINLKINIPKPKKREILTKEQLRMYQVSARELCSDGNRAGIWIGLSLIGLKSSEIWYVQPDGEKHIIIENDKPRRVPVPAWLVRGLNKIDRKKWKCKNNAIRKGVQKYGASPNTLYISAIAHKHKFGNS